MSSQPAAANPAIALPSTNPVLGQCSYPDLGQKLEVIYRRWLTRLEEDRARSERFDRRMFEETGLRREEWPHRVLTDDEFRQDEFERVFNKIHHDEQDRDDVDEHGCSIGWDKIHKELHLLCATILDLPAHNLADLALHARATALYNSEFWTVDERDQYGLVNLVDGICRLAGVEAMPGLVRLNS